MTKRLVNTALFLITTFYICLSTTYAQNGLVKTIYFKSNSFSIDKKFEDTLNLIAKVLGSDTVGYLTVMGYADTKEANTYEDELSEKRAFAVYSYLSSHAKFDTTRVNVTSLGKSGQAFSQSMPDENIPEKAVEILILFNRKKKTHTRN